MTRPPLRDCRHRNWDTNEAGLIAKGCSNRSSHVCTDAKVVTVARRCVMKATCEHNGTTSKTACGSVTSTSIAALSEKIASEASKVDGGGAPTVALMATGELQTGVNRFKVYAWDTQGLRAFEQYVVLGRGPDGAVMPDEAD